MDDRCYTCGGLLAPGHPTAVTDDDVQVGLCGTCVVLWLGAFGGDAAVVSTGRPAADGSEVIEFHKGKGVN